MLLKASDVALTPEIALKYDAATRRNLAATGLTMRTVNWEPGAGSMRYHHQ